MLAENLLQSLFDAVSRIGADPEDDVEVRLEKTLLVTFALMVSALGLLWGSIYLAFGERMAAAIPYTYSLFSLLSISIFGETRAYGFFRSSQLVLILVLPFLLMVSLGGFINASAVILWSLLCPFGALLFVGRRKAISWFAAYVGLVVVSALLQRFLRVENNLTPVLILAFFVMNISAVSAIAFITMHYFVSQREIAFQLLDRERQKSEDLLLNMLPQKVAEDLKNRGGTVAQHYPEASVLFADIVDFTGLSTQMSPADTVQMLNDVFTQFDAIVARYRVEKIRTIGDSYMIAAGVPRPRPDHAQVLACVALDMLDYINIFRAQNGVPLHFRIGMNSGPLVAGVVGRNKYQYDLWGDAVNIASRMESHGEPDRIQISQETYELLKAEFVCKKRGRIPIKGRGRMKTWFLARRRDGSPD